MQLGAKGESCFRDRVIEWLLAHPVSGQKDLLTLLVPDSDGEHATQELQTTDAVPSVQREDDLGVGVGLEHIARRFAVLSQRLEVVDLAVEHDAVAVV